MLKINIDDVINVIKLCLPYLIGFGVFLIAAIITMIACRKKEKPLRKMIRFQSIMAILLALVITLNMICFGPMYGLISLATSSGKITQETLEASNELCEVIAEEGIVLLQNDENLLPLSGTSKINVFGWGSTNPCYGGTGSGSTSDAYDKVTLLEGLENANFEVNKELVDFYTAYRADRPEVGMWEQDWTLPEPTAASYGTEMMEQAKAFSDKAVVVITRVGGEGADLPTDVTAEHYTFTSNSEDYPDFKAGEHYLQLSQTEKDMLDLVSSQFDDIVLVYNGANAFELDFVNDYSQIKSVVWVPGPGQTGFNALGEIISGEVNPSGKTSDTFVKDLTDTPTYNNFGYIQYDNMAEFESDNYGWPVFPTFVNYTDNIYVGYRFYETAAAEGLIKYEDKVMYPFGHGLSYTDFKQEMSEITVKDGEVSFDVTVTNTGDVPGKDVVEIYYNPPYTNGGIEKSSVNLIAFEKTELLEPGKSETLHITFMEEDMASYDAKGAGCYVLEGGEYGISIRKDSHTVIEEKVYNVASDIIYNEENKRSTDDITAVNQFEHAEGQGQIPYLSRKDGFANYEEAVAPPATMSMPEEDKATFNNTASYNPEDYNDENDKMPVTNAKNGLELAELRGASYDDERWEQLLDQLSIKDMTNMIAIGGYQTAEAKSVKKVMTIDCDGPASINNNFTGVGSIGFPSAVMIGSTWNEEIAEAFGESIGKMADEMNVSGWYAPAMNIHRSAFAGRNFEYYSEDGYLSGVIATQAVKGAEKLGVYAYLKHFALNDQETNRDSMLCTWSTEQAIREIYLKPFEMAVKEGGAKAMMSSFNYIGAEWAGGSNALLNEVLREEWGFHGMVLSDYLAFPYFMNADQAIRNGTDFMLVPYDVGSNNVKDTTSATSVQAMRQASKNIMYTTVNSRAYGEDANVGAMKAWEKLLITVDVILLAGFVTLEVVKIKKYKISKANPSL